MNASEYLRKCATDSDEANFETQFADESDRGGSDIRPLVYATDVFIPLVDLREESKCDVDATLDFKPGDWVVTACRFFKAAYALLGWVVTTLALLTFSGVMRHRLSQD